MKKTLLFILMTCLLVGAFCQNPHYASKVVTDQIQAIGDTVEIDSTTKIHANLFLNGDIADSIAATRGYVAANGGTTVNGTTDNGVLTYINSSGELQVESGLTFDGTTMKTDKISSLSTNGDLTLSTNGTGNILNVGVTFFGSGVETVRSTDPIVNLYRNINSGTGNAHAFSDASNWARPSAGTAYNSFDARITMSGSTSYDHYAAFQSAPASTNTGTLTDHYGYYSVYDNNSSGTITNLNHFYIADGANSGTITNQYGIYMESLPDASNNYAIWINGNNPIHTLGNIEIHKNTPIIEMFSPDGTSNGYQLKSNVSNSVDAGLIIEDLSGADIATFNDSGLVSLDQYGSGSNTGTAAYSLAVDASGNVIEEASIIQESGEYTPTLTNSVNVTASTVTDAHYVRTGDYVWVSVKGTVSTTSTATSVFRISLPIAISSGTQDSRIGGVGHYSSAGPRLMQVYASNLDASVLFLPPTSSATNTYYVTFGYIVE